MHDPFNPPQRQLQSATPSRRAFSAALAALALTGLCSHEARAGNDSVNLDHARSELQAGRAILIDIREPAEHAGGVAAGARLLPMRQLPQRVSEIPTDPAKPVLLICNTQNRSSATLRALRERGGYSHVRFVEGGMSEWSKRGWPLVKPGT